MQEGHGFPLGKSQFHFENVLFGQPVLTFEKRLSSSQLCSSVPTIE